MKILSPDTLRVLVTGACERLEAALEEWRCLDVAYVAAEICEPTWQPINLWLIAHGFTVLDVGSDIPLITL